LIPASQRLWVFSAEEQPANASHFFHVRSHCFTLSRFHTRVSPELEHDQATKLGVLGLVNHTHPAAADPAVHGQEIKLSHLIVVDEQIRACWLGTDLPEQGCDLAAMVTGMVGHMHHLPPKRVGVAFASSIGV
jgi:hypothetical protein